MAESTPSAAPGSEEPASVPVALFAYRRHRQLAGTLEALSACPISRLYVFSDAARGGEDAADVLQVRRLLESVDWIEPVIVARDQNAGLSTSIREGLDSVFEDHETAIVIEDDVRVAPEFYDYARRALERYRAEPSVAGITGLRYPFDRAPLEDYPYDVFLSPRFSSWGWATWRERWREFDFDVGSLRRRIRAAGDFRPELAGADLPAMIHETIVTESLTGSWDVLCATNMLLTGRGFVTPAWNMVENTGLSEGTHAAETPAWQLRWEHEHCPAPGAIRFAPPQPDPRVLDAYLRFFEHRDEGGGAIVRVRGAAARWRSQRRARRAWGRL